MYVQSYTNELNTKSSKCGVRFCPMPGHCPGVARQDNIGAVMMHLGCHRVEEYN
jgi:hypothetical protein